MNNLKNWIFEDSFEASVDFSENGEFRKALKTGDTVTSHMPFDTTLGRDAGSVLAVRDAIAKYTGSGELKNYVILTKRPGVFFRDFISNNIIDIREKTEKQIAAEVDWVFSGFGKDRPTDQKTFAWSDPHFSHRNIIKYCNRPWHSGKDENGELVITEDNVRQMDDDLIRNYNSVVGPNDICYCLGDFCLGSSQKTRIPEIISKLNGKLRLVMGNHDNHSVKFYYDAGFERVYDRPVIIKDFIILSHAPLQFLNGNCPFYSCYGHVHDSVNYQTWTENSCCACVERHSYTPVSFDIIKEQYEKFSKTER